MGNVKKAVLPVVIFAGAALVVTVFRRVPPPEDPMERLSDPEERRTALAELLRKNAIAGLPAEFNLADEDMDIEYYAAVDNNARTFALAIVTYRLGPSGVGMCSFVFDKSGRCVLWSPEGWPFLYGGLLDLTGDGYLEKIVAFTEEAESALFAKLQVFRIDRDRAKLLLEVHYNLGPSPSGDNWWPDPIVRSTIKGKVLIELTRMDGMATVSIAWSPEDEAFVVKGRKSRDWRVVFPGELGNTPVPPRNVIGRSVPSSRPQRSSR